MNDSSVQPGTPFPEALQKVKDKLGKTLLSDDDLIILACGELARTYTRDEKNYT